LFVTIRVGHALRGVFILLSPAVHSLNKDELSRFRSLGLNNRTRRSPGETDLGRTALVHHEPKSISAQDQLSEQLTNDVRWHAAQLVVASAHFSRAPLLTRFLLHIVAETIEGCEQEITEHRIGVRVFDRPAGYRTVEDNIVRNYARQLRKRLADYYAAEGANDAVRIDIPLGGYVPAFHSAAKTEHKEAPEPIEPQALKQLQPRPLFKGTWVAHRGILVLAALLCLVYSGVIAGISWFASTRAHATHPPSSPTDPLWHALFDSPLNTYIIPSDAGFNLLEDVSHQPMPLADYIKAGYLNLHLPGIDTHSADDLRSQEFTSFVDVQALAAMERLPEFHPERDMIRFPRSLHLEDLKDANAIILGSEDSNPWAALAEASANFRILDHQGMSGAVLENAHPRNGEKAQYISHWNEPAHETFALIEYLPNLNGTGHILLLQGLDVAGTQAAVETIFHPLLITPILATARGPNGKLRPFEILLRSTSIASNAAGTEVIASRID
jgi:hypothetical protein